tara:strand:+ start:745 stop:1161 length:417 start_codon:yes stop_codon:yes gene_type:complete
MDIIFNSSFLTFSLLCIYIFFLVLFLQSGLDKIFNWKAELNWIKPHFSKTIFKSFVPTLLFALMLLEVSTGLTCFLTIVNQFLPIYENLPFFALFFSSCTLLCLFLGQRIAKDYQGAISIAIYFGINLWGLFILSIIN